VTVEIRPFEAAFGAEVVGLEPRMPLDDATVEQLRRAFDERSLLLFRDLDLQFEEQVYLVKALVRREHEADPPVGDNWYISNQREDAAAPYGRLQFHADAMWADQTFESLSLYGLVVDEPVVPTTFVSGIDALARLSEDQRARIAPLHAAHTTGEVRRGDLTDVLLTEVENAITTAKPLVLTHPRTGVPLLYASEQMTKAIVEVDTAESEELLAELFAVLYEPAARVEHHWRERDFVVWDNIALQHARPNVPVDGPARTLRKVAFPMPSMDVDQMPAYSGAK
jgi:alpha-ketoglutarate-dependent taurine dioxygenase